MRWQNLVLSGAAAAVCGALLPLQNAIGQVTIGANFKGSTLGVDSGFIPPDTNGSVGIDHFVELINGRYSVYRKSDGVRVQTSSLNSFWTGAGITITGNAFDPRVVYDQTSGRWIAVALDNGGNPNNYLVGVSNTSDPTAGWKALKIDSDSGNTHWTDFPGLGVNADGVFLSGNQFAVGAGTSNISLVGIPKVSLMQSTPTAANMTEFEFAGGSTRGFSQQPVVNFGPTNGREAFISRFDNTNRSKTFFNNVNSAGAGSLSATTFLGPVAVANPPFARQPNGTQNLETSDGRFSSAPMQVGSSIWAVHCVSINSRAAIRWYEIDEPTNTIKQTGTIDDGVHDFIYPSISANANGDVVIGYSRSGPNAGEFVSAYASVGSTSAGVTTFAAPMLLQAGVANYFNDGGSGRNRWGDYSYTSIDPADPQIFWTIQEYVSATNVWSTNVSEIIIPLTGEKRWKTAANGSFSTGSNWIGGAAPGAGDHVILSRSTTPGSGSYTVTLPGGTTTNNRLSVRQGVVNLDLNGGTWALSTASSIAPSFTVAEYQGRPTVNISNGTFNTVHTALAMVANGSAGSIGLSNGSQATVNLNGNATWNNSADMYVAGTSAASGGVATLNLNSTGGLNVGGTMKIWNNGVVNWTAGGGLSIVSALNVTGGKLLETANGSRLLKAGAITTSAGGIIDVWDNDVQVRGGSTYAQITSQIASARNGGAWNGTGITSTAAKNQSPKNTTIGVLTGTQYLGVYGGTATFGGSAVASFHVLGKYTYYGDTDFNGVINFDDYARTDTGFATGGTDWFRGDFDYNNVVNFDDYALIDLAFNTQSGTLRRAQQWLGGDDRGEGGMDEPALQIVLRHYEMFGDSYASSFLAAVPEPGIFGVLSGAGLLVSRGGRGRSRKR